MSLNVKAPLIVGNQKVERPESGFSRSLTGKDSDSQVGDMGLIPESGRSPGEENGNPLQYSCLENPMERGDWRATVHGLAKS